MEFFVEFLLQVGRVRVLFMYAEWLWPKRPHKTPFRLNEFLTTVFLA
jgi:hypothetical protein